MLGWCELAGLDEGREACEPHWDKGSKFTAASASVEALDVSSNCETALGDWRMGDEEFGDE